MLSGRSAAMMLKTVKRGESTKILSSLRTDSRFQYRHYYHIQQFFVAYFALMHKMAEDSNNDQDTTRLHATLAYMFVQLKREGEEEAEEEEEKEEEH